MRNLVLGTLAFLICIPAFAAFKTTNSSCTKAELAKYYSANKRGDAPMPACLNRWKSSTPTINNCKSATEKNHLGLYLSGDKNFRTPPKCYKPAKWIVPAKDWSACSRLDKIEASKYFSANKRSEAPSLPACVRQ